MLACTLLLSFCAGCVAFIILRTLGAFEIEKCSVVRELVVHHDVLLCAVLGVIGVVHHRLGSLLPLVARRREQLHQPARQLPAARNSHSIRSRCSHTLHPIMAIPTDVTHQRARHSTAAPSTQQPSCTEYSSLPPTLNLLGLEPTARRPTTLQTQSLKAQPHLFVIPRIDLLEGLARGVLSSTHVRA